MSQATTFWRLAGMTYLEVRRRPEQARREKLDRKSTRRTFLRIEQCSTAEKLAAPTKSTEGGWGANRRHSDSQMAHQEEELVVASVLRLSLSSVCPQIPTISLGASLRSCCDLAISALSMRHYPDLLPILGKSSCKLFVE